MKYTKKVIGALDKCYALSELTFRGQDCLLVAAEKHSPCYLYDLDGNRISTVWEEPGGVMTMVPFPGQEDAFLATHRFYSPNDSKDAVLAAAQWDGEAWQITELCALPFVHRFDIFSKNGVNYILACTLKSDHEYKDDWRFPGKLWAGVLPDTIREGVLKLTPIMEGLSRNHGYTRFTGGCEVQGVVSCQSGVYLLTPPSAQSADWHMERLLDEPVSDAVLVDLDGDGDAELFTMSPFHGDQISIYHKTDGAYKKVYEHPEKTPFLHAICSGEFYGTPVVLCGNREGKKELLCFRWDPCRGEYCAEQIDRDCGPANCLIFKREDKPVILAANREVNEIALYEVIER